MLLWVTSMVTASSMLPMRRLPLPLQINYIGTYLRGRDTHRVRQHRKYYFITKLSAGR